MVGPKRKSKPYARKAKPLTKEQAVQIYDDLCVGRKTLGGAAEHLWGSRHLHGALKYELTTSHGVCTEADWLLLLAQHRAAQTQVHRIKSKARLAEKREANIANGLTASGKERSRDVKKKPKLGVCECGRLKTECKKKPLNKRDKCHPDCYREGLLRDTGFGHMVDSPDYSRPQYITSNSETYIL